MIDDLGGYEADPERLRWMKRLRQREGIDRPVAGLPLEIFGADDWDELRARLTWASWQIPGFRMYRAVANALGIAPEAGNVVERRTALAKHFDVSVRTIERLEERGFVMLDYMLSRYQLEAIAPVALAAKVGVEMIQLQFVLKKAEREVSPALATRIHETMEALRELASSASERREATDA